MNFNMYESMIIFSIKCVTRSIHNLCIWHLWLQESKVWLYAEGRTYPEWCLNIDSVGKYCWQIRPKCYLINEQGSMCR